MARLRGFPSVLAALTVGALTVTGAATFASTVTATGQLLAGNGSAAAPSYSFTNDPDCGMYLIGADNIGWVVAGGYGAPSMELTQNLLKVYQYAGPHHLRLLPGDVNAGAAVGSEAGYLRLFAGTHIVEQRDGANAQSFRVYETFTDSGNYRLLNIGGNGLTLQSAGTGVGAGSLYLWNSQAGALEMATSNTRRWIVEATGSLVPYADNTYNIGSLTNRPTFVFCVYSYVSGACTAGQFLFPGMGGFWPGADGVIVMRDTASTSFGRLCFGGTTSAFPALKRSGAAMHLRLADDSAYADLNVNNLNATVNVIASNAVWAENGGSLAGFTCYGSGKARWTNAGGSDFDIMVLGSATDAYPAIKRSGATLVARLGDDSGNCNFAAANIAATGYLLSNTVYDVNSVKILGAQGAAVADATGAGDVVAQLNTLLARCRAHGLIAT